MVNWDLAICCGEFRHREDYTEDAIHAVWTLTRPKRRRSLAWYTA